MSEISVGTESAAGPDARPARGQRIPPLTIGIYAAQFLYGGWFLFHGLNDWLEFYPDQSIRPGPGLVPALAQSGLMAIVKALEIAIGCALLAHRFSALAVVAAWPITLTIAFVTSSHGKPFGIGVAIVIICLNALMSLGYLHLYRPMLALDAGHPVMAGTGKASGPAGQDGGAARLTPATHGLAALAGIIAAIAITYLSLALRR